MDRLLTVLLGSLFAGSAALAHPAETPRPAATLPKESFEIRREVEYGGPVLGVQATELTPELQDWFGADGLGVLVSRVFEGSAAADAGISVGDVVVSIDGEAVASVDDLRSEVLGAAGKRVAVEVVRDGAMVTLAADLPDATAVAYGMPRHFDLGLPTGIDDFARSEGWRGPDDDAWRAMNDDHQDEYLRLERHLEELQERLDLEFEAIHDRLDLLEDGGPQRPEVK